MTILAEAPAIVTPTGLDVDADGSIYVVACHTHFRPASYVGPERDEILVFSPDGTGRRVFYNKTRTTMQLRIGNDGWVYIAQRDRVLRIRDTNRDGEADVEETIATLNTIADYPHNGLSGLAWHPEGGLLISLGENFGKDWTLTVADGSSVSGRGEGGVFTCTPEGTHLRRIARGFWNPFGIHVRDDGLILAAENDPGSRPPCRLLHIVDGADYGFQYVYGSAPIHPFVAWVGELRGTLGMVTACGEGPCSVVELGGGVLIPSWSDRTIDYYPLHWKGASLRSERIPVVQGDSAFRPVGMTRTRNGDYLITDWGSESYEVNGKGRLWKLTVAPSAPWIQKERDRPNSVGAQATAMRAGTVNPSDRELFSLVQSSDRYLADAALASLARRASRWSLEEIKQRSAEERVWTLVALRRNAWEDPRWVEGMWDDEDPEVRFECLRWISDAVFTQFLERVESMMRQPNLSYRLFEAGIATLNTLRGNPSAGVTNVDEFVQRVSDPNIDATGKAMALRSIPADHPSLSIAMLKALVTSESLDLATEATRTLAMKRSADAGDALMDVAKNPKLDESLRADAIAGLFGRDWNPWRHELESLREHSSPAVRREVSRLFLQRAAAPSNDGEPQTSVDDVLERLDRITSPADRDAGRRVFFHAPSIACSQCHRFQGRGNVVGPDLSLIARQGSRREILQSIVEPNRNVAPQYFATYLELENGSTFTGILLRSAGYEVYRNSVGDEVTFQKNEIAERRILRSSLMPQGLHATLSDEELRDVLAFLTDDPKAR